MLKRILSALAVLWATCGVAEAATGVERGPLSNFTAA